MIAPIPKTYADYFHFNPVCLYCGGPAQMIRVTTGHMVDEHRDGIPAVATLCVEHQKGEAEALPAQGAVVRDNTGNPAALDSLLPQKVIHVVVLEHRTSGVSILGAFEDREAAEKHAKASIQADLTKWGMSWEDVTDEHSGWSWGDGNAVYLDPNGVAVQPAKGEGS